MCDLISQVDSDLLHDSPDVCVLSTLPVLSCTVADSTETTSQTTDSTIRDKFYVNMKTYESNWSGQCILFNKIQYDSKGVTSNFNRHVKTQ